MRNIAEIPVYYDLLDEDPTLFGGEDTVPLPEDGLNEAGEIAYPGANLFVYRTEAEAAAFRDGYEVHQGDDDCYEIADLADDGWAVLTWTAGAQGSLNRDDRRNRNEK